MVQSCRVSVDQSADARLAELGLDAGLLNAALRDADAEARIYTPLDPPTMAGVARYARTVRSLRERLLPRGWSHANPRNLCQTISPAHDMAIITTLGDENTGDSDSSVQPATKYEKGITVLEAVAANDQLTLFPLPDEEEALSGDRTTWVLLYHVGTDAIRAELSCPAGLSERHRISVWSERIILPEIPLEPMPDINAGTVPPDDGRDLDVFVERR